jgi:hypothetical protein
MDKYFLVKNGLVNDPKHWQKMGDAIRLYLYLVMWSNSSPEKDKCTYYHYTFCKNLKVDKDLAISWLKLLEAERYITILMASSGMYVIKLNNPIKVNRIN